MRASTHHTRRRGHATPWAARLTLGVVGLLLLGGAAGAAESPPEAGAGRITGIVRTPDGRPLADAEVVLRETGTVARTDAEGRFAVTGATAGICTLQVSAEGYVPQERALEMKDGSQGHVPFELKPVPHFLSEVVVTPSLYTLYEATPGVTTSLSRQEIERVPHFADDVLRAVRWLPGTSGEDFSGRVNVRGGDIDETLVLVDGLEIHDAFHLKELFGGIQSVVDAEAIDGLDFMSGGFPVEFGNRMSGVIDISSLASGPVRTSLVASTTHLGLLSAGPFASERGRWLATVRRTNLDNVIRWIDPESGLEPVFYDVMGKVSYTLGGHSILTAHVLGASDRTRYEDETEENGQTVIERMDATSSGRYAWLSLKTSPAVGLSMETVLSAAQVEREITGLIDEPSQTGVVDDRRRSDVLGLRQDWKLDLADRHLLKWGFEAQRASGSYRHQSNSTVRDRLFVSGAEPSVRDRDYSLEPEGELYAAYAADRMRLGDDLVAEIGLRWDRQTWADDSQLSPRLSLSYALGDRTTLRGAWGLYHQPQLIHELQVSDGVTEFQPAQRAEHRVVSVEHRVARGFDLRLELYQKLLSDVRARYENVLNPIELFPELESDRVLVAPDRAEARGVEVSLRHSSGSRWSWWLSYAFARAEDEIEGEWVPRSRDQPHTASFSLNFRPGQKWNVNLAGRYHTGWPTTVILGTAEPQPDGGVRLHPYLGPRNSERYPDYLRLDLRASRVFEVGPGTWSVFLEVTNLLNRDNPRGLKRLVDYRVEDDGTVRTVPLYRSGLPLVPSLGIRWNF
ncbi:MAG: TonB-dependent receptor [Acidobacteria bacterium]|nr:TonB-dependent receptor [Acidobacteriota bacterium]